MSTNPEPEYVQRYFEISGGRLVDRRGAYAMSSLNPDGTLKNSEDLAAERFLTLLTQDDVEDQPQDHSNWSWKGALVGATIGLGIALAAVAIDNNQIEQWARAMTWHYGQAFSDFQVTAEYDGQKIGTTMITMVSFLAGGIHRAFP